MIAYHRRMKTRGERLRARRLELGLTLREVSDYVDISIPGVQNLERTNSDGTSVMPSLLIGAALAKCYKKSVEWILTGEDIDPRVPVTGTTNTGPQKRDEGKDFDKYLPLSCIHRDTGSVYALTISSLVSENAGYQVGDYLLLDSAMEPISGEDVLVMRVGGDIAVLRLSRIDEDGRFYFDFPGQPRVIIEKNEIEFLHQIIGTIKSFAVERSEKL
jgi:transcriptional regulator with XRE-family HTH domain